MDRKVQEFFLGANQEEKQPASDKVRASEEEFTLKVSPICTDEQGKKYAFVTFEAGGSRATNGKAIKREAEGRIPDCKIIHSQGFGEDEIEVLELYLKSNLTQLKKMAAQNNVMRAFMKD